MAAEVEYLAAQLWQLPIMQAALEESEASGHTCGGDHCSTEHADGSEGRNALHRTASGNGFSDGDEQQQLAMMLNSLR